MTAITVTDLTTGVVSGDGVFDELMKAANAHIDVEYKKNRIKGSEYSTVYLGAMQSVISQSLQLLLSQQKVNLEAELLTKQLESENLRQAQLTAQTALIAQQEINLAVEALNIPKQGELLDSQVAVQAQQEVNLVAEGLNIPKQGAAIDAEIIVKEQQAVNLVTENKIGRAHV